MQKKGQVILLQVIYFIYYNKLFYLFYIIINLFNQSFCCKDNITIIFLWRGGWGGGS